MEQEIKKFITFWDKHKNDELSVTDWLLTATYCPDGCCHDQIDLDVLCGSLKELLN